MFSFVKLRDNVKLIANELQDINKYIINNLKLNYENKIINKLNAYTIKILDVCNTYDNGIINDIDGSVYFTVDYISVIFTPTKNEILNITISESNEIGLFGFPTYISHNKDVQITCICPKDIITDYKYSNNTWSNDKFSITNKSEINIKILNYQIDFNKIIIIGNVVD